MANWEVTVTITENPLAFQVNLVSPERVQFAHVPKPENDGAGTARLLTPLLFAEQGARERPDSRPLLVEVFAPLSVAYSIGRSLLWTETYFGTNVAQPGASVAGALSPNPSPQFEKWLKRKWRQTNNTIYGALIKAGEDLTQAAVAVEIKTGPEHSPCRLGQEAIRTLIERCSRRLGSPLTWSGGHWTTLPQPAAPRLVLPVDAVISQAIDQYRHGQNLAAIRALNAYIAALPHHAPSDCESLLSRLRLHSSLLVLLRAKHLYTQELRVIHSVATLLGQWQAAERRLDTSSKQLLRAALGRFLIEVGACLREAGQAGDSIKVLDSSLVCLKNTDPVHAVRAIEHIGISKQLVPGAGDVDRLFQDTKDWAVALGHSSSAISARLWPIGACLANVQHPQRPDYNPQRDQIVALVEDLGGIAKLLAYQPGDQLEDLNYVLLAHLLAIYGLLFSDEDIQVHAVRLFKRSGFRPAVGLAGPALDATAAKLSLGQITRDTPKRFRLALTNAAISLMALVRQMIG